MKVATQLPAFLTSLGKVPTSKWQGRELPYVTRRRPTRPAYVMSTSMPEIPEIQVPEPATPKETIDPNLGTETAVVSVESSDESQETTWLDSLLASRPSISDGHPFASLRSAAEGYISELPLPNRKQESWRFTDLRSVYASRYESLKTEQEHIAAFDIDTYVSDVSNVALVFVDGVFNDQLSRMDETTINAVREAGGYIGSVQGYEGDVTRLHDMWSSAELSTDTDIGGLFPVIGNVVACDAAVVDIPANFKIDTPVALCFMSTGGDSKDKAVANAPRVAVIAGEGANLTLLECYASLNAQKSFSTTFAGTAIKVEDHACVSHYFTNTCADDAQIIANLHAMLRNDSTYELRCIGIGGKVGRVSAGIDLEGEGSRTLLHGALLTDKYRVQDLHSRICHNSKNTKSNQLQKSVATGHGRVIFNGKIVVTENCLMTDSKQLSKSLLLSEKGSIDAMPVLEIANDDVQCSHGATVSDLSDDELFYCQSRGLTHQQAQALLVLGFANETLGECPFPSVVDMVREKVSYISEISEQRTKKVTLLPST